MNKITEAIQKGMRGSPAEIPDCGRDDLPQFFVDMGYKVGVEIGTSHGVYAEKIAKAGLKLYCVDPWVTYPEHYGNSTVVQAKFDDAFDDANERLAPYDCTYIRKFSMDAVKDFDDESLDFVYIDGNHDFKFVAEDIYGWSKKVKKGGTIAGHDYFYCRPREFDNIHVKYVVDGYTQAYRIYPWYVLGRKETREGEVRDNFRSFMWIKK